MTTLQTSPRVDALAKVTGQALYTEDLPAPAGLLYAAILRSPYSHARILSVKAAKAAGFPGVVGVLTREHLGDMSPYKQPAAYGRIVEPPDQPFIAMDKVRFHGEPVAAVAAESLAIAEEASKLIEVEYEELPAVFDVREAMKPGAPLVHEEEGTNFVGEFRFGWGDVEQGFRESDHVFEDTYVFPSIFHYPIENIGGGIAEARGDEIELIAPIQHLFTAQEEIATLFGVDQHNVRIRMPYVGGGFGAKELKSEHLIAIWLARTTGRPVKVVPSAEGSFRTDCRHMMVWQAKTGVRKDGTLVAQEVLLLVDKGGYAHGGGATGVPVRAASLAWGPYRVPHLRVVSRSYYTNKVPAGAFRSLGRAQTTWGYECHYDLVARRLGIDPMEFRLRNFFRRGDHVAEGTYPFDADMDDLLGRAVHALGWDGHSRRVGPEAQAPKTGARPLRGRGMATTFRHGYSGTSNSWVTVTVDKRSNVRVLHTGAEIGQGLYTVLARVAAQTLGVPQDQVQVSHPDTMHPYSEGIGSSRDTVSMGMAAQRACEDLGRELLEVAAKAKGGRPEEWRLAGGRLWHGEEDYSLGEAIAALGPNLVVMGKGYYSTPRYDNSWQGVVPHWELSAAAAEVEVDPETGDVRLLKYAIAADVGKAIHPGACQGQLEGGGVMGLGDTFYEEVVYRDGQLVNGDPFQYRLPLLVDLPEEFHAIMVENADGPGPQGSKGMSQTAVSPIAPAVANAVYEAIGVRVRELPITPDKVLRALGKL